MNIHFYEFLGNYFISLARGQKQIEDMAALFKQGFGGSDELTELFMRSYGITMPQSNNAMDLQTWQKAISEFQQTFNQFGKECGWVPKSEHQETLDNCTKLEQQVQEQQQTINRLRELLNQKGLGYTELFEHFKSSLEDQGNAFESLLESINKAKKDR